MTLPNKNQTSKKEIDHETIELKYVYQQTEKL